MSYTSLYTSSVERWRSIAATMEHEVWNVRVPATPAWTVAQVAAHLAGVTSDVLAGRLDGSPGDAWTARQVSERQGKFGVEIVEAWSSDAPLLAPRMSDPRYHRVVLDAWNHYVDVLGAIGRPVPMTNEAHQAECAQVVAATVRWVNTRWPADLPPVLLKTPEGESWLCGHVGDDPLAEPEGKPAVTATASGFEWARALAGRRTPVQMRSYEWSGDPEPYLPHLALFPTPDAELPS